MAPVDAALQELLRNDTERSTLALSTVQKIVNNILSHQDDPKYRRLRTENKAIKEKVLSAVGGGALLEALGFAAQGGDELVLPMQASPVTLLQARMEIDTALKRMAAEEQARHAAESGDEYQELLAKGIRYGSQQDHRRAARTFREAITLSPDRPTAYHNLGSALKGLGHHVEAAQRFLEATDRYLVGSGGWATATANAFTMLVHAEVAKPEWCNDEGLKAMSARVVRAAPGDGIAHQMRANVLSGHPNAWEAGPRSMAELREAATHYDRAAALCPVPAAKAGFAIFADVCRRRAAA